MIDSVGTNAIGYGPDKPFTPPLMRPEGEKSSLLEMLDRNYLLGHSGGPVFGFLTTLWPSIIANLANGDSADGFVYNNAVAAGL